MILTAADKDYLQKLLTKGSLTAKKFKRSTALLEVNRGKTGIPLSSKQEVPNSNSPATGTADVSYNKDNKMLTYTINWTGLTNKPSMAHIHGTAAKGVNAGVKHDLSKSLPKTAAGNFSDSVKVDGVAIKEDSLLGGFYYFNIHTPKNPGGEIRGQIEF